MSFCMSQYNISVGVWEDEHLYSYSPFGKMTRQMRTLFVPLYMLHYQELISTRPMSKTR